MKTKYYTYFKRLCNGKLHNLVLLCMITGIVMSLCCTPVPAEPDTSAGASNNQAAESGTTAASGNTSTTESSPEWPVAPDIFAQAGVVIDASTGTVLYNKNMNDKMYPASITKILTTLIAMENCSLSETVTFSHNNVYTLEYGDANISMNEGEQLSMIDCLYGVMLASANECANATGEHCARKTPEFQKRIEELKASGESYDESVVAISVFADMMNARAKKAGAINSHFNNPSGLFDENHYTTCYDMAMITRDAIKCDEFINLESNTTYTIGPTNMVAEPRYLKNRHKMLFPANPVYYEGIMGGKTGYVDQSGNTLVTFAKRNGMTLISVVMKSNSENVYKDTTLLLDYGFNNFKSLNISENETKFSPETQNLFKNVESIFDDTNELLSLNKSDNVVIPASVNFSDVKSEIHFLKKSERPDENTIANLDYYYCDRKVGETTLKLSDTAGESFKFGANKNPEKDTHKINWIRINIWILLIVIIVIAAIAGLIYYTHFYRYSSKVKNKGRSKRRLKRRKKTTFKK